MALSQAYSNTKNRNEQERIAADANSKNAQAGMIFLGVLAAAGIAAYLILRN